MNLFNLDNPVPNLFEPFLIDGSDYRYWKVSSKTPTWVSNVVSYVTDGAQDHDAHDTACFMVYETIQEIRHLMRRGTEFEEILEEFDYNSFSADYADPDLASKVAVAVVDALLDD